MKIYLAARYARRLELAAYAKELEVAGHEVTSRWLLGLHAAVDGDSSHWGEFAQDDVDDIARAEMLIAFTESMPVARGGRHVEMGIALGSGRKVMIVGPCENVFCALPDLLRFDTWDDYRAECLVKPELT